MSNRVYVLSPREDWIVDRFVKEWNEDNSDICVRNISDADVVWLFADWCYNQVDKDILRSKKVITTIHHIVEEKFNQFARREFEERDILTDVYHVPNIHTENFIKNLTKKPIHVIPYWANQKIWKITEKKESLKEKYKIPKNRFVIGSFQRDTEGHDLKSPKLEKGPDLLANYIEDLSKKRDDIHVLLAGWRRQFLIQRLEEIKVGYSYIERPSQEVINELYQCLDLYPVTARVEGGPQSLIECGLLGVPVVSRDVGMASQVLSTSSICENVINSIPEIPRIESLKLPEGYEPYRKLILSL